MGLYWLKGGLIAMVIPLIYLFFYIFSENASGYFILVLGLPFLISLLLLCGLDRSRGILPKNYCEFALREGDPMPAISYLAPIISFIAYFVAMFVLGAVIGWLIEKFKNRQKSENIIA